MAAIQTINALREPSVYDRIKEHGLTLRGAIEAARRGLVAVTSGGGAVFSVRFLKAGDVVELSVDKLGTQRQECADA